MYKGTGFVPVISSLKAHPRGRGEVPAALQHYLDNPVLMTNWYPEKDFIALTECLAALIEQDGMKGVWTYFGKVAAERDLKGSQDRVPAARRARVAGVYRRFAADEAIGVGTWLTRMPALWALYHDTGRMVLGRSAASEQGAVFRLYEYSFMTPHMIELLTAYWSEYATIVGLRATLRFAGSFRGPAPYCEWELACEATPEVLHALAAFPVLL
jgi:hypothetical protein